MKMLLLPPPLLLLLLHGLQRILLLRRHLMKYQDHSGCPILTAQVWPETRCMTHTMGLCRKMRCLCGSPSEREVGASMPQILRTATLMI